MKPPAGLMMDEGNAGPRRELRLALVLYGGVSLCIYMHGTTKEINRLVAASAALAAGLDTELGPSEKLYRDLLQAVAERDGVRTEVCVDVIAGTSAGGINGVYLAKALAHNRSQDALRDLWFERGDIHGLLRGPSWLPLQLRAALLLPAALLPRLRRRAPLKGRHMAVWLYEALAGMDHTAQVHGLPTLMPSGASLDLMVTMTDYYGYNRRVAITDPTVVCDEQHRHVFRFSQRYRPERFGAQDNLALAFAARATSCFPGAFDPVNPGAFCGWVSHPGPIPAEFFRAYELSDENAHDAYFVDGGVLDNKPFAPAIEALRGKPAQVDVERWVLYLDPDPAPPLGNHGREPAVLGTVLGSLVGLPRKQPILDSLLEIERMNTRVLDLRDVIEESFAPVRDWVSRWVPDVLEGPVDRDMFLRAQRQLAAMARAWVWPRYAPYGRFGGAAYLRTRVASMIDTIAQAFCAVLDYPQASSHAMLTQVVLRDWAQRRRLFEQALRPAEEQIQLLEGLDVDFALRRAHFTLAGLNWLYPRPPATRRVDAARPARAEREQPPADVGSRLDPDRRVQLDLAKARLWQGIDELEGALPAILREHAELVSACFDERQIGEYLNENGLDGEVWLTQKAEQLDRLMQALAEALTPVLEDIGLRLYGAVRELEDDRDLRVRYVGFPLWDAQLFPLQYAAGVTERDRIDVMRLSPVDATLLRWPEQPKLKGVSYGHFGAFFEREWRENDYLAGRLDGAERLVKLVLGDEDPDAFREWAARAFLAILQEEQPALETVGGLMSNLCERAEQLTSPPVAR